jgi:hypothetical protein
MDELKKCYCGKEPIKVTKQSGKHVEYAYTCICGGLMAYDWSKTVDEAKEKWNNKVSEDEK